MWVWQSSKWPEFTWETEALVSSLFQATEALAAFLQKMHAFTRPNLLEAEIEALIEDSIETSKIEGEILSRDSVRSSVLHHLTDTATGVVDRSVDGLVQILLDARQNYQSPLSQERLEAWHAGLFPTGYSGIHKITVGRYRTGPVAIVSGRHDKTTIHYEAPPATQVNQEMQRFLDWFNIKSLSLHGLIRAGLAHLYFEFIHPFDDGNGRIGRAILDLALAQYEHNPQRFYSLSGVIEQQRKAYYTQLQKVSIQDHLDVSEYLQWFLTILTQALTNANAVIALVLKKTLFWQTHEVQEFNPRQQKALNNMLDCEEFTGGMTTQKYMHLTKVSRATAYRELTDLVVKRCLVLIEGRAGRNVGYRLNV